MKSNLTQAILVLAAGSLTLTASAAEHTGIGTIDKATLEKVHPAKPAYSPHVGREVVIQATEVVAVLVEKS